MKRLKWVFVFFFVFLSTVSAESTYFDIRSVGSSASSIGMGRMLGFNHSAATVFETPSGLYDVQNISISAFSSTLFGEVNYTNLAFAKRFDYGVLGFGYYESTIGGLYTSYQDSFSEYKWGNEFSNKRSVFSVSYGADWTSHLFGGISVLYFQQNNPGIAGYNNSGFNADFGLTWHDQWGEAVLSAKNILRGVGIADESGQIEPLATAVSLGGRYKTHLGDVLGQLQYVENSKSFLRSLGYRIYPMPWLDMTVSVKDHLNGQVLAQTWTAGMGLTVSGLSFQYAFEPSGVVGTDSFHFFSLSIDIPQSLAGEK